LKGKNAFIPSIYPGWNEEAFNKYREMMRKNSGE
jgi:hypothetical protein